jgi:hypothetical protein
VSSSLLARGLDISTVTTTGSPGWSSESARAGAVWGARRHWLGDLDGDRSSVFAFFALIRVLTKRIKRIKNDYFNKKDKNLNNQLDGSFESG